MLLHEEKNRKFLETSEEGLRIQHDLALKLCETSDLNNIMEYLLDSVTVLEGIDCGGVYLVDQYTGELDIKCSKGLSPDFVKKIFSFKADSPQAKLVMKGQPVYQILAEILSNGIDKANQEEGLKGIAVIPILYEGKVIAVLNIASHTHNEFNENTRSILESLAAQLGSTITRAQAEKALRESEENYATVVERSNDGLVVVQDGFYKYVNKAWILMTGYSHDELINMTFEELAVPEQRAIVRERYELRMKGEIPPPVYESKILHKNGTVRDIEISAGIITYNGKPADMAILRDITDRKQAEAKLRESERKWRSLAENIPAFVSEVDRDGRILSVNRALPELREEQVLGTRVHDWTLPEHREIVNEKIEYVFRTGRPVTFEHQGVGPDGKFVWYENYLGTIEGQKQVEKIIFISQDITDRKKAEESLRESEEKYSALVEQAKDGVGIAQDGVFKYVNEAIYDITGYSNKEILGMNFLDLVAPEEKDKIILYSQKRLKGENVPPFYETKILCKDGTIKDVESFGAAIQYKGRPANMGMLRDITERKQMENALHESETQKSTILQTAMDGYWLVDSQGRALDVNDAACKITGYTKEELLTMSVSDIVANETAEFTAERLKSFMKNGFVRFESKHRRKDGSIIDVEVSITWIPSQKVFFAFLRDITMRQKAEEDLRESEEKYSALVEQSKDGVLIAQDGVFKYVNKAMHDITGFSKKEILGMNFLDLLVPEYKDQIFQYSQQRLKGEDVPSFYEAKILCKDGTIKDVESFGAAIQYKGRPANMGMIRDITERKRMEEELKAVEQQLRSVVQSAPLILWSVDSAGRILLSEGSGLELLGLQPGETVGQSVYDVYRDFPEAMNAIKKALTGELSQTDVNVGDHVWHNHYQPIQDSGSNIVGIIGVSVDISKRKQAEEELRKSKNLFQTFMNAATENFGIYDSELNLIEINKAGLSMWPEGTRKEDLIGKNIVELAPNLKESGRYDQYMKVVETGEPFESTNIITEPSFGDIYLDVKGFKAGKGFGLITTNVTERKRAEDELVQHRKHLEKLVEERTQEITETNKLKESIISTIPLTIVVLNRRHEIVAVNEQFFHLFSIENKDVTGMIFYKAIESRQFLEQGECEASKRIKKFFDNNHKTDSFENIFEQVNNSSNSRLKYYISQIIKEEKEEEEILLVIEDITKTKMLENQVVQSERLAATGRLAASIAHEINNPLQGISIHLDLMKDGLPKNSKKIKNYEFVKSNITKIGEIVGQLLDIYRGSNSEKNSIDINDLIHKVLSLIDNQMRIKKIKLELNLEKKLPKIIGWQQQLHQIILNLLLNAMESIEENKENKKIIISTSKKKDLLQMQIKDNGKGIKKNDVGHIFDPFFSTKKDTGVGLGLFVCQGLAKNHDGDLTVESKENKGSDFTLTLPWR